MPGIFDHLLVVLVAVVHPVYQHYSFPNFRRAIAEGVPNARRDAYRRAIVAQWLVVALIGAIWISQGREITTLGVGLPESPSFVSESLRGLMPWMSVAVAFAVGGLIEWQLRTADRDEEFRRLVHRQLSSVADVLPRSASEMHVFRMLSLTAGVCEELVFRGFLIWYFAHFTGAAWSAVLLSSLLFGVGHAYQGRRGIVKLSLVGLFLSGLYLFSGTLLVSMILHAFADWRQGRFAYRWPADLSEETSSLDATTGGD